MMRMMNATMNLTEANIWSKMDMTISEDTKKGNLLKKKEEGYDNYAKFRVSEP